MRTFLSAILTLVAMAAIVVAFPSLWVKERLVDPEGFVATVTPMAQDQRVKDYLAGEISSAAEQQVTIPGASAVIEPAVRAYTGTDQFEADFVDVVSQQHAWLFDPPPPGGDNTVMELDITDMVNRVIATTGISARVSGPIVVPLNRGGSGLEAGRYHEVGQQITALAYGSLVIAVAAGILALLIARRRGTVLAWLGIGVVASAVFAWAVGLFFAERAKQEVEGAENAGREVAELIIDGAVGDLHHLALIVGAVGVGVVIVGFGARVLARR
ncbi:hypothetical protein [Gordonia insulae]|uniref:Uncharacterized protein n=1 Tax=Gordonia insulae TaxID=2420509 RepID=A0A3G8JM47_9ACTN|nr:hypothetical protein [Gordonia insulae]AZG46147.1 hypothetical protein D7316_02748 [Gordonia insulae]